MCSRAISVVPSGFCLSPRFAWIGLFSNMKMLSVRQPIVSSRVSPLPACLVCLTQENLYRLWFKWQKNILTSDFQLHGWLSLCRAPTSIYISQTISQLLQLIKFQKKSPIRKIIPLRRNSEYGVPNVCPIALEPILAPNTGRACYSRIFSLL